jgi:outer membrane scaffolding protein for murein synthesis (MipA/OmpV family)
MPDKYLRKMKHKFILISVFASLLLAGVWIAHAQKTSGKEWRLPVTVHVPNGFYLEKNEHDDAIHIYVLKKKYEAPK